MRGKILFVLLFLGIFLKINAQINLVANGGFETFSSCPNNFGQLDYAVPWLDPGGSSDFFNSCAPPGAFYGVPRSFAGYQYPKTGNGFAGIYCYYEPASTRDYIQASLSDSLITNSCYLVSFFINLHNDCIWSIGNVGANFSDTSFINPTFAVVSLPAQITKFNNPQIIDTLNWIEIKGVYTALGGEKYFTIGNFTSDSTIDTLRVNPSGWFNGSYYYVDDVSVIPIDSIPGGLPAFAGEDTTVISGDSVFIGQEITGLNCNWYIGTTLIADSISGLFVSPAATTTYTVEQNLCGTITYDTVTVNISGVGINEISSSSIVKVFPNPTTGALSVYLSNNDVEKVEVKIFDMLGKQVYTSTHSINGNSATFNLDLQNGIYLIEVYARNEKILQEKVIMNK